jgi:two-component system, sensor histidine kinase YesM
MPRRFAAKSFLRKFLVSLLPVALPLVMLGGATIYVTDDFIGREVVSVATRQLDNLKEMLDVTMFELDALNLTFSVNTTFISMADTLLGDDSVSMEDVRYSKLLSNILSAQSNARPYVSSVYFYLDRYPDRFLTANEGLVHRDSFRDKLWIEEYAAAPRERLVWTRARDAKLVDSDDREEPLFTIYRRLFPASSGGSGVIVVNIERSHFDELISKAALFKGQSVYLLDEDGSLILENGEFLEASGIPLALREKNLEALGVVRNRGKRYYAYSSQTSRYGWRVVSTIPASSLESLPLAVRTLILVMLGLSLVIGATLALSVARRNSRRLASVVSLFERAEAGEDIAEKPAPRYDEYDRMIEGIISAFLKQRYASLQLSERQARAEVLELKALRAQMNPHFLFNTLESLYWMTYGSEGLPSPASTMIKDLSMLLKYSLEDSEEVALSDEIDQAKRYLAIQQFRYTDKFKVLWDIEPETLGLRVVKFFLQPLLENSIYHGIRDSQGQKTLRIGAALDQGVGILEIIVEDDGLGMSSARLDALRTSLLEESHPSDHIGLYNTNRHIQLVFGREYGLSIGSRSGAGTTIHVRFPAVGSSQS